MAPSKTLFFLSLIGTALTAANCTVDQTGYTCPTTGSFNYCAGDSLKTNIIVRCVDGCAQPGNCNDNLAGVPPVSVKSNAQCYQDSPTAGNGQCTFDCVAVIKADGTSFYPVGCSTASVSSSGAPVTTSSTSSESPSSTVSTTSGSSQSLTDGDSTTTTTSSTEGSGGQSGSGGEGGATSSTTYLTTTLPGGQVSTSSSIVIFTPTSTPPALSNDANGRDVHGLAFMAMAGLIALIWKSLCLIDKASTMRAFYAVFVTGALFCDRMLKSMHCANV